MALANKLLCKVLLGCGAAEMLDPRAIGVVPGRKKYMTGACHSLSKEEEIWLLLTFDSQFPILQSTFWMSMEGSTHAHCASLPYVGHMKECQALLHM